MSEEFWRASSDFWEAATGGEYKLYTKAAQERDEAREIARELFAALKQLKRVHCHIPGRIRAYVWHRDARDAYMRIRPGVRKWLEE